MKRVLTVICLLCLILGVGQMTWATDYQATSGKLTGGAVIDGNYVKMTANGNKVTFFGLPSTVTTITVYYYSTSGAEANLDFNGKYNATVLDSASVISETDPKGSYAKKTYYIKLNTINNGETFWLYKISDDITDTTAPEVNLTAPLDGDTVSDSVTLSATATDNVGVTKVAFYYGEALIGSDTSSPYSASWNTTTIEDGSYTLTAKAYDAAGNVGISKISVIVDNTGDVIPPTVSLTAPADGDTVSDSVTLSATATDNVGVTKVAFYYGSVLIKTDTSSPYSVSWDTTTIDDGSYTLTAKAYDAAGNVGTSTKISVIVNNTGDVIPPAVSLTAPVGGSTVSGKVTISATATDNVGVTKVTFYYGSTLIGTDTSSPYSVSWDTTTVKDGSYTLTAKACDAAGNSGASSGVSVTVSNISSDFRDETVYFMMTDRFVDGDSSNNSLYSDEYRSPNNSDSAALRYYNGGDFKGLINNLDYIKGMGFTAIWITPVVKQPPGRFVNSSGSYDGAGFHGYWGYDFDSIDPHLESANYTFKDLIAKAHAKGIKIVLDIVPNHGHDTDAASSCRWYSDRLKVKFNGSWWTYDKSADPYVLDTNVSGIWDNNPGFYNYLSSYKLSDLIDFNECDPRFRAAEIAVYKKFIDMGVDGFRIDTVAYMRPDWWDIFTNAMWTHANSLGKPGFWQVGEAWVSDRNAMLGYTNPHFAMLDLFGSCMDYMGQAKTVFSGSTGYEKMINIMASDSASAIDPTYIGTFIDNHDKPRFQGSSTDTTTMATAWKNASNWYWLARGIPVLYYGSEFEGSSDTLNDWGSGDPINRKYVGQSLINKVLANPTSYPVYQHIKVLNSLRQNFEALRKGTQTNISLSGNLAIFRRTYKSSLAYVAINKGSSSQSVTFSDIPSFSYYLLTPNDNSGSYDSTTVTVANGSYTLTVAANSFAVLAGATPESASSVTINGSYTAAMTLTANNQWEATVDITSLSSDVNLYFDVTRNGSIIRYGDDDEIYAVVPMSDTAVTSSANPVTIEAGAGPAGAYKIVFNDAFNTYSITYTGTGTLPTVLEVFSSAVSSSEWMGVCGSYSPVTNYSDSSNHAGNLPWWEKETAATAEYFGIKDGKYVWIWKTGQITAGAKFEWKPRRNGSTWYSGSNVVGYGGAVSTVTAW